ncbi:hypothetical protein EJ03DRAFT_99986 [Teratosphaeria nubilosa]|uniref:Zn(2)-C6 fungal-type domain-containing protein n=1 Tax=Teratosphaeria nubilosa TaxID=161662 RepID=A0A6G1L9V9_9PEZI|nr:hypothetical protein EJ03DRAFT_99986 [Teratosphaeria nubilosa]
MLAHQAMTMPGPMAESPYSFEHHVSHSRPPSRFYGTGHSQRTTIALPPPLEPRPIHHLQPSLSDHLSSQRHPDAVHRIPGIVTSESRLPGLKDILTPQSHCTTPYGFAASAGCSSALAQPPSSNFPSDDGYHSRVGWHPPLALHPPTEVQQPYQQNNIRRLDLPVREPSPVQRHKPPSSHGISPYTPYAHSREYPEARPERLRQGSTTSYATNSAPSPYNSVHEDGHLQASTSSHDRSSEGTAGSNGPECQRKYLCTKEIPGEGTFHLYEGGYRIPSQVDGEQVNPAWGLTKANKPRKRLALACLDCREKKIKCEPGASSCLQCEKAKRPCRRAPTQHVHSETTVLPAWQGNASPPPRKGPCESLPPNAQEYESEMTIKRRSRDEPSPPHMPLKKHRSISPESNARVAPPPDYGAPPAISAAATSPNYLVRSVNPRKVDSETRTHLLDLYFAHVNNATYSFLPRKTVMDWASSSSDKSSRDEQMVMCALLAVGSSFGGEHFHSLGQNAAETAKALLGSQAGSHTLVTVLTNFLLGIYCSARGSHAIGWDHMGAAIRGTTKSTLQLNQEDPIAADPSSYTVGIFSMSREQVAECRRRIFWACFLADRYEDGTLCAITLQDIFLRLPSTDEAYEGSVASDAPYFNNGIVDPSLTILTPASPVSPMAWLAVFTARWGDVLNFTNRAVHRPRNRYREVYEQFYSETYNALEGWLERVPDWLKYEDGNITRSLEGGYAAQFITLHALYHFTLLRLNRYVRRAYIPDLVPRNIVAAHYHAHSLLTMLSIYMKARQDLAHDHRRLDCVLSTPFLICAIMSATDVLGAGGPDFNFKNAVDLVGVGLECLRELVYYWTSAQDRLRAAERRYYEIKAVIVRPNRARNGAWLGNNWGLKDPMQKEYSLDYDCIGGTEHTDDDNYSNIYFAALREGFHDGRLPSQGSSLRAA